MSLEPDSAEDLDVHSELRGSVRTWPIRPVSPRTRRMRTHVTELRSYRRTR